MINFKYSVLKICLSFFSEGLSLGIARLNPFTWLYSDGLKTNVLLTLVKMLLLWEKYNSTKSSSSIRAQWQFLLGSPYIIEKRFLFSWFGRVSYNESYILIGSIKSQISTAKLLNSNYAKCLVFLAMYFLLFIFLIFLYVYISLRVERNLTNL